MRRRRRTDRIEAAAGWVGGVLSLVLVAAAVLIGMQVHSSGMATARSDAATKVAVEGTLLEPADGALGIDVTGGVVETTATATWTAPDGSAHTGAVPVLGSQPAGSTTMLWVDRAGDPTTPPVDSLQAGITGLIGGAFVLIAGALLLLGLGAIVRAGCAAANAAAWAREWSRYEPVWSGR